MPRISHGVSLALVCALAACQAAPGPAGVTTSPSLAPTGPAASASTPAQASAQPVAAGVITGTVVGPADALVSALAPQLPAARRLLALATTPVSGAVITLLDAQGQPQGTASVTTDGSGAFTLSGVSATGLCVVQARYTSGSQVLTLQTLVNLGAGAGAAAGTLDASTTLVAKKLQAMISLNAVPVASVQPLTPGQVASAIAPALTSQAAVAGAIGNANAGAVAFDNLVAGNQALATAVAAIAGPVDATWLASTPSVPLAAPLVRATGTVSTLAGTPSLATSDGSTSQALFISPRGIVQDANGNIYLADGGANLVRKISSTGQVSTLAGSGLAGFADGVGASAQFSNPAGLAIDASGTLYVADQGNQRIRKLATDGTVTTVAGSGLAGNADGAGAAAAFHDPHGIAVDKSGNLYVADTANAKIRKVTPDGTVSTLAGSGAQGKDDGTGTAATFATPQGLAFDPDAQQGPTLYVTDPGNNLVRSVSLAGVVKRVAGNSTGTADGQGSAASFETPQGIAVDFNDPAHSLIVADTISDDNQYDNQSGVNLLTGQLRRVQQGGATTTISSAGTTMQRYAEGLTSLKGQSLAMADTGNGQVLTLSGSTLAVLTGTGPLPRRDGKGTAALFSQPHGLALDKQGNLYVADTADQAIRKITSDGTVTTFAGGQAGDLEGTPDVAQFNGPTGLCFDPTGNLMYVAEPNANRVRVIDSTDPTRPFTATLAGNPTAKADWQEGSGSTVRFDAPHDVAMGPDGLIYVADTNNHRIRTLSASGQSSTYAGTDAAGTADGSRTSATFELPMGLAFAGDGTLYIVDAGSHSLRKITRDGSVSTVAGHVLGEADGQGLTASFDRPAAVTVDAQGIVYIADAANHRIRRVQPSGAVDTYAGVGLAGYLDGAAWLARFDNPQGIVAGANGQLFVADADAGTIRRIAAP